jgi:hypothetical protein
MHGNLSKTASFSACDSREPLLTRSLLSDPSHNPTGVTPPTSFLQLPARGSGSAATLGTQPLVSLISQNGYLGHGTLVWRNRTEGGSHSTIGMV